MLVKLTTIFDIETGHYHSVDELDSGSIPLVSCGEENNGVVGYYDIDEDNIFNNCITVAYNGLPLTCKYHPYGFGAKDDVAILKKKNGYDDIVYLYTACVLSHTKWRYSYGRKCYRGKLNELYIDYDDNYIKLLKNKYIDSFNYIANMISKIRYADSDIIKVELDWQICNLEDVLNTKRGDFHSLQDLELGNIFTVSRTTYNNGVEGRYELYEGAEIYSKNTITISTLNGRAYVQLSEYMATDNVIVCHPKKKYEIETILFIALMLNRENWRYNYGRQCYYEKVKEFKITLPFTKDGDIDEKAIKRIVSSSQYYQAVKSLLESKNSII